MWYNGVMAKKNNNRNMVVNWDAKEYVTHDKNKSWYVWLIIITLVLVAAGVWLKWWTFVILVVLSAIVLWLYAARPARVLHYSLGEKGLSEGNRLYGYETFRAFGVLKEENNYSIVLIPRKRFSPSVKVYFPEESGEAIVDAFGAKLPMEEVKLDFLDKIVSFLRI